MKKVVTIAGSDSCGGAGIQADLKVFSALEVYGMSVITAVTAQNTQGVFQIAEMTPDMVQAQIDCLFEDIEIDAVKIGMVSSSEIIKSIGEALHKHQAKHIVVDPVMVSKSGSLLLKQEAKEALIQYLFPLAAVITPNLPEAEALLGRKIHTVEAMKAAAKDLVSLGAKAVVVKGGHLLGDAVDVLYDGKEYTLYPGKRYDNLHTHGTGCTFSSAIASYLAKGHPLIQSVEKAKEYVSGAILHGFAIGKGVGPTHHFYKLWKGKEEE